MAREDVLVVKLFAGEDYEHETTGYPIGGGDLPIPRVDFMVSALGVIEAITIPQASTSIPTAVLKNAPDRPLRPIRVSEVPDAMAIPRFPEAMDIGRVRQPAELPTGHLVEVVCSRSGRIVAFIVHNAAQALRPELLPPDQRTW